MYNDSKCDYKSSICCKSWIFASLKSKIHQNWKIRPFFKSAHQADSKNAKTFEKSSFFEEILSRKPLQSHATSQFFCSKKLVGYAYDCA